jgi:hypothetical protein
MCEAEKSYASWRSHEKATLRLAVGGGRSKAATIAVHWFLSITGGAMRSDRSVADNVVQEGVDDRDPLAKFRRADDELTFKELLAGKIRVPEEKGELSFWELMPSGASF